MVSRKNLLTILAILSVVLIAALLRWRAVERLPIDYVSVCWIHWLAYGWLYTP